jgi:hypothetical protein
MNLSDLESCLDRLGIKLSLRLIVDAPCGAMTSELKRALAIHKPDLLARLIGMEFQSETASLVPSGAPGWQHSGPGIADPIADGAIEPPVPSTSFKELGAADLVDDYAREERAAIMEFDGGLTRNVAERAAAVEFQSRT